MNPIKYIFSKKYREAFQTEFSKEISYRMDEEFHERKQSFEDALHPKDHVHHKL